MITMKEWGVSTHIDLYDCDPIYITKKEHINNFVVALCEFIDMKRYGDAIVVHFGDGNKEGYSLVQLIETSCITGHFANESNSAFIDIFSCKYYNELQTVKFIQHFFLAKKVNYKSIKRGL